MGSSPSKGVLIEEKDSTLKQKTEKNTAMTSIAINSGGYTHNASTEHGNMGSTNDNVDHQINDDDDNDDVCTQMSKLKDELDEILGIPPEIKTNARVPEPLQYDKENLPAKPKKLELGKGNTWKMPNDLVERELSARHARILEKMKELMVACEDEEIDASPWIQSICNDKEEAIRTRKEDTSGFDPKKFKEANIHKCCDHDNSSSLSITRTINEKNKPPIEEKPANNFHQLSYNSSEEALIASIENQYASK